MATAAKASHCFQGPLPVVGSSRPLTHFASVEEADELWARREWVGFAKLCSLCGHVKAVCVAFSSHTEPVVCIRRRQRLRPTDQPTDRLTDRPTGVCTSPLSLSCMPISSSDHQHYDMCYRCVRNKRSFGDVRSGVTPVPPEFKVGDVPTDAVNIGAK